MKRSYLVIAVKSDRVAVLDAMSGGSALHEHEVQNTNTRPFLKWAGGKQWLARGAPVFAPAAFRGRYFEPFLGGGAFFFALDPESATIGDTNDDLIVAYRAVRDHVDKVLRILRRYPYDKGFYYELREARPTSSIKRAARFIYLNRTCWNGLYRVNKRGEFNVPFGRLESPTICDETRLRAAARALKKARLCCADFEMTVKDARAGDFVYFDPPYTVAHGDNGFRKYNSRLFSWTDQERLAECAGKLAKKGVYVLVSNAHVPEVLEQYKGFYAYVCTRKSLIAGLVKSRRSVNEVLLSNYPLMGVETEVL